MSAIPLCRRRAIWRERNKVENFDTMTPDQKWAAVKKLEPMDRDHVSAAMREMAERDKPKPKRRTLTIKTT